MSLIKKTDEEIIKIATPLWDELVKASNRRDYSGFTKNFSAQMLYGANEVEIGKQWASNKLLTNLSENPILSNERRNKNGKYTLDIFSVKNKRRQRQRKYRR